MADYNAKGGTSKWVWIAAVVVVLLILGWLTGMFGGAEPDPVATEEPPAAAPAEPAPAEPAPAEPAPAEPAPAEPAPAAPAPATNP